jgi:regulator of sigma E protease
LLTSIQTVAAFAFVLGVLIFVHELGHYLMARRVGVRVLKFSLGFGPRLLGFRRGDTEYCVSVIPLGGYVKMAGETTDDPRSGADDEFLSKSKWQRFQVLIMGPLMNILLAVVVLAVVLMQGAEVPAFQDQPPVLGVLVPDSPAARAGLQTGDLVLRVGDRETPTWEQLLMTVGTRPNRDLLLTFRRDGRESTVTVTSEAQGRFEIGEIGVLPDVHPELLSVEPGDPAEAAGVMPGDVVLAVDGVPITFAREYIEAIRAKANVPITLTVLRAGASLDLAVTPELRGSYGWIGTGVRDAVTLVEPGPIEAVGMSVQRNWEMSGLIFETVWGLLTRETSPRQLMGPVAIMQLSGESAQAGWVSLLSLMAMISLNLGILNLLPIPVLDGGHITIIALESLARRDFSARVKEKMVVVGLVLLMMLMVTVIYNDLTRVSWIERLMPWR